MNYREFEKICENWKGKVCLYGAGLIGKTWGYDVIVATGLNPDFYCDKRYGRGDRINGIPCTDVYYLETVSENVLVFMTLKEEFQTDVKEELMKHGISNIVAVGDSFFQDFIHSIQNSENDFLYKKYECIMDDKKYVERRFETILGYRLNLDNPRTFNEKMQWLKLYDRKPMYTTMVDKNAVKEYVARIIGQEHIIPTIGVWDKFEDIDFDSLPNQFVLKCTHDSGGIVICYDKTCFDYDLARRKINKGLNTDYYLKWREWPYKNVKPRIIAEQFMDDTGAYTKDYKFFCFEDKPDIIEVDYDGFSELKRSVYGLDWEVIKAALGEYNKNRVEENSNMLNEMISMTKNLSENLKMIRTDFYVIDTQVFWGEFTFYQDEGFIEKISELLDTGLSDFITLPNIGGALIKKNNIYILFRKCNLSDYKVYCYNGKANWVSYITGRNNACGATQDFYDTDWNYTDISMMDIKNSGRKIDKPPFMNNMILLSEKISSNFGFIRCDWYCVDNQLFFGETTFYDGGGFVPFNNLNSDLEMGKNLFVGGRQA